MIEPNWKLIKQLKKEKKDNQNKPHLIMKVLKKIKEYQVSILIAFSLFLSCTAFTCLDTSTFLRIIVIIKLLRCTELTE